MTKLIIKQMHLHTWLYNFEVNLLFIKADKTSTNSFQSTYYAIFFGLSRII